MIHKRILVPDRVRRPPATGWSWIDRRFVAEHAERLSREALLLYFFLCAVADRHGLSFYNESTLALRLRLTPSAVTAARDELLARNLIAHERPLTQVLSVPRVERRRCEPGQGLLQLGELFRQIADQSPDSATRRLP